MESWNWYTFKMEKLQNGVSGYLYRAAQYSTARLIIEAVALTYLVKVIAILLAGLLVVVFHYGLQIPILEVPPTLQGHELVEFAIYAIFFAPLFETLVGQLIPIALVSYFTKNKIVAIVVSAISFALPHIEPVTVFFSFFIGLIFAIVFIIKKKSSTLAAFTTTAVVHMLHNVVANILVFGVGYLFV